MPVRAIPSSERPETQPETTAGRDPAAGAGPPPEVGGRPGPEPTRYGDWEVNGICTDF